MKDWQETSLGDLCEMKRGPFGSALKKEFLVKKGENTFKVYGQQNSIQNDFKIGDQYINEDKREELKQFVLNSGDLILTTIGTIGRIAIVPENIEPGIINSMLIRFKLNKKVLPKFFIYLFDSKLTKYVMDNAYGNAVKQIPKSSELKRIKVYLPPLETQKHIVSILERAEKLKEKRQITNEDTNKIIQSVFYEMFGDPVKNEKKWTIKKWEEVVQIINGKNQQNVIDKKGKYPIYGSGGNIMGYANEYLAPENSIIIGRKGTINRPIKIKTKFWNVDTAFALVPKGKEINYDYLFIFCQLFNFEKLNTSTTLPSLTKDNLLKIDIAIPPIGIQNQFAEIVQKIESLKEKQKQSTDDINQLFDALMQKAFNGELVE
jgi:type I restriction enzyme, S subunit